MTFRKGSVYTRRLAVCIGIVLCFAMTSTQASPPEGPAVRVDRNNSMDLLCSGVFNDRILPFPGLRYTHNFSSNLALTVQVRTVFIVTTGSIGANWYFSDSHFSPYVFGRLGGGLVFFFDSGVGGVADVGAGIEYTTSGGFNIALELGPVVVFGEGEAVVAGDVTLLFRVSLLVGPFARCSHGPKPEGRPQFRVHTPRSGNASIIG
jgi:hypothetical protein